MARARAERTRSKTAILEDLAQGMERLQSFIPQIEDLGRDGFPYLEGARARTELQLKECIKKTFGEKSPEFQTYRQHRLSVDTPADTKQTVALLKNLIAALEDKKLELQGLKPPPSSVEVPPPPPPPTTRPQMTLVPSSMTTAQVTITPAAPATPPPMTMSVALTTNLDMAQPSAGSQASSSGPASAPVTVPESMRTQPNVSGEAAVPVSPPQPDRKDAPPEISPQATAPVAPIAERIVPPAAEPAQAPARAQAQAAAPLSEVQTPPPVVAVVQETKIAQPVEPMPHLKPQSTVEASSANDPVDIVKSLCKRFHMVARQLRLRGEYRATLDVEDELDAQDLLHGLLRLHFDDIETTEWLPSYSNGTPRIMFLLNDSRLAVMVKKTRTGLTTKDLTEQLRIDVEHSRTLKRCSTLLCFVYDPEGRIGNPRGLETDLISISDQMTVDVYVAPK